MINARAETLATKPAFRTALKKRRCLIPADGFYEWERIDGAMVKQPYYIRLANDRPFAFAGLWESRRGEDGPSGELHHHYVRTEHSDGRAARPHAGDPSSGPLRPVARSRESRTSTPCKECCSRIRPRK